MEYLKLLDVSVSVDSVAQNNGLQDTMQNSTSMDVKYSEENGSDVALECAKWNGFPRSNECVRAF